MSRFLVVTVMCLLAVFGFTTPAWAQATDGNLVGNILDATGAVVPNATLELENPATNVKYTARTNLAGLYRFNNIPAGAYKLTATAQGFAATALANVSIELNKTTTANLTLQVGTVTTAVEVVEASALIDTTTATISGTFDRRQALDVPITGLPLGVLNLALLGAGVASSGGLGLGEGPSVGGQRPRQNSFNVEGVDNNRKDVTGHTVDVPNEAIEQFTMLQNQFSAEFGHSNGGQFNTIIKGGTNELHGAIYEYMQNRKLNAVDEANARQDIRSNPRYDQNRLGASIGGPIKKNKLFYFGTYEYNPLGRSAAPAAPTYAPTADGYTRLAGIGGLSQTNLNVLKQYLSPAPTATRTTTVLGTTIPIGILPLSKPDYTNTYYWLVSGDYNISERDQLRTRYIDNRISLVDSEANLPIFYQNRLIASKLFTLSEFHNFSPNLINELRLQYSRYNDTIPAGNFQFPGLDAFPNITLEEDLNLNLGPDPNAPQSGIQNTYQIVDNVTWTKGRHTWKFGVDARKYIAPTRFVQRERGDYYYSNMERYLRDLVPDVLAERNVGGGPYIGNQINFYWFVNDDIRIRPGLTLNLGVRHEYKGIARDDKLQALNSVSSVPGLLEFRAPKAQKKNFMPRVGIAYSPGTNGLTTIRAGFGMGYDVVFDNLGTLSKPVQLESTIDDDTGVDTPNYLRNGGIRPDRKPDSLTPAEARAFTSAYIADQLLPYSIQWNLGVQRVMRRDYTVEVRYLGTRGVHLLTQDRMNVIAPVTPDRALPTYLQRPSQADLDRLTLTLPALQALPFRKPEFTAAGFQQNIVLFPFRGNSIYHGLAAEVSRRFIRGLLFKAAYTWSHNIDDSTADLFSTLLSPRRPQDFQDMRAERSSSFIDRRHRLTYSWVWDVPWFAKDSSWFKRNLLGNLTFAGVYTAESPQYATVQSGVDSNLNRDAAGDRVIINTSGTRNTGSGVTPLNNSAGARVAYLANDPNAHYIVAGVGGYPNGGRQTMALEGINNFDFNLVKRFSLTETKKVEIRAAFINAFNHPQYVPGSLNTVQAIDSTATRNNLIPGNAAFNRPDLVYASNARSIQLGARISF